MCSLGGDTCPASGRHSRYDAAEATTETCADPPEAMHPAAQTRAECPDDPRRQNADPPNRPDNARSADTRTRFSMICFSVVSVDWLAFV